MCISVGHETGNGLTTFRVSADTPAELELWWGSFVQYSQGLNPRVIQRGKREMVVVRQEPRYSQRT